jgi:HEAT repeat protein
MNYGSWLLCIGLVFAVVGDVVAQQAPPEPAKVPVEREILAAERPNGDFGGRPFMNRSGMELQTTCRWQGLEYGLRYRYEAEHADAWLKSLRDDTKSIYARLVAAFYLLDDHEEARKFIAAQMKSPDLRSRHNAAAIVNRYVAPYRKSSQQAWGERLLIDALADGSLDGKRIDPSSQADYPEGDRYDFSHTPIDDVCRHFTSDKHAEAVPALISVLKRRPQTGGAAIALSAIGDERAIPILMQLLVNRTGHEEYIAYALAKFKHGEAVPIIAARLGQPRSYTWALLEALLMFNDRRAVEPIEKYLAGNPPDEEKSAARRVLVLLRSPDPVKDLIELYDRETEWLARTRLIDALAERHDARVTTKFTDIARTSDFADDRQNALDGLARIADRRSLLALASLLDQTWPTNLKRRSMGKPTAEPDYGAVYPEQIQADLKHATKQDFGRDRKKWETWIEQNVPEGNGAAEKK